MVRKLFAKFKREHAADRSTSVVFVLPAYLVAQQTLSRYGLEWEETWNKTQDEYLFRASEDIPVRCPHSIAIVVGRHRKPSEHIRLPPASLPKGSSVLKKLVEAVSKDKSLSKLLQDVVNEPERHQYRYASFGDLLWRTAAGHLQLVVPKDPAIRELILRTYHESEHSGHQSAVRTLEKVQRRFWWDTLAADVKSFCKNCHVCQTCNTPSARTHGALNPLAIPTRKWECVTMDFVTGLPATAEGYDAVMTVTDKLTKMVHLC